MTIEGEDFKKNSHPTLNQQHETNMKPTLTIFLFILSLNGLIGQNTSFYLNSLEYTLDNKVILEGCDTASFSIYLNLSDDDYPVELTLSGTTDTLDYWTNLNTNGPTVINSSVTIFPIQLFPYADTYEENGETLIFTFKKSDNSEIEFNLVFIDEPEELSIFNPYTDVYCQGDGWDVWQINMRVDSSFIDIPHEYIFQYTEYGEEYFFYDSIWGCYPDEYTCPLPDTFIVEVHALNCILDTVFAEVFNPSTAVIDTFTCQNEREMDFDIWSTSFIHSQQEVSIYGANAVGCDSILDISTEFFPVQLEVEQIVKNSDDVYLFNNIPITEYGNYEAHYINEYGCDSSFFATIIPYTDFPLFNDIPNGITQSSSGCTSGVCLPLFFDRQDEFDYFIDDELLIDTEFEACDVNSTVYYRNIGLIFPVQNEPRQIKDLEINEVEYPDIYCNSIEEFSDVINSYNEDLEILGISKSKLFAKTQIKLEFKEKLLNTGNETQRLTGVNSFKDNYIGIFIPIPVGMHELKLKHKYSSIEKTVLINLENHTFPVLDTIRLNYFGELDQRVNFPLPSNDLCGEIVSAMETCSNVSPAIVDFTLSNQGLLSFKPLVPRNFSFCIEICDDKNVCQIVVLEVNFEEADDFILHRNIFPNPAKTKVTLTEEDKFNIEKVVVHNALGRQVETLNFEPESYVEMDISKYPEGIYFLTVHINGENYLHKLLIQR